MEVKPPEKSFHSTWDERRWVLAFAGIVMLLTSLPYFLGYATQGADSRFTGFVFGSEDGNSYIAKMLSGATGSWLFRSPYTAASQRGAPVYLPYLLLGKLASPPALHEQLVAIYHIFRLVAGFLMVLATYDFLAFFINDVRMRRFGLALVVLGGGLGWLLIVAGMQQWLGSLPLEFYSPESFGFLSIYGLPHLALARALVLWALVGYLRAAAGEGGSPWWVQALKISALWLLAGIMQPLTVLVIGAVIAWHLAGLAAWQAARSVKRLPAEWQACGRLARLAFVAGVLPALFIIYNLWMTLHDPFLSAWTRQNVIRSPHPVHYLLAYGLILPYAWLGGRRLLKANPWTGWLPVGWVLLFPLLVYSPLDLQRRFAEGVWAAWVVLALAPLDGRWSEGAEKKHVRRVAPFVPLLLLFISTLFLWVGGVLAVWRTSPPLFLPADQVAVFENLALSASPGEVVLASYETGNPLPAWAPLRVLIGHGPESADQNELLPRVAAFYQASSTDAQRLALLREFKVGYVFWGPAERLLGDWNPRQAGFLEAVHQVGDYSVFRVVLQ